MKTMFPLLRNLKTPTSQPPHQQPFSFTTTLMPHQPYTINAFSFPYKQYDQEPHKNQFHPISSHFLRDWESKWWSRRRPFAALVGNKLGLVLMELECLWAAMNVITRFVSRVWSTRSMKVILLAYNVVPLMMVLHTRSPFFLNFCLWFVCKHKIW